MQLPNIIFIIAGVWTIIMGISQIGINMRRMQRMVRLIGEVPTRILYIVSGIILIVVAFTVDLGTL
jgi:hypothetical protein